MMFIPNQWYAIVETTKVKTDSPTAFKRLGQQLVLWRDKSGKVVVMEDRCPHRQVKLSLGKVKEGFIECPFHGFQYDRQGHCQLIPANGKTGPRPKKYSEFEHLRFEKNMALSGCGMVKNRRNTRWCLSL